MRRSALGFSSGTRITQPFRPWDPQLPAPPFLPLCCSTIPITFAVPSSAPHLLHPFFLEPRLGFAIAFRENAFKNACDAAFISTIFDSIVCYLREEKGKESNHEDDAYIFIYYSIIRVHRSISKSFRKILIYTSPQFLFLINAIISFIASHVTNVSFAVITREIIAEGSYDDRLKIEWRIPRRPYESDEKEWR